MITSKLVRFYPTASIYPRNVMSVIGMHEHHWHDPNNPSLSGIRFLDKAARDTSVGKSSSYVGHQAGFCIRVRIRHLQPGDFRDVCIAPVSGLSLDTRNGRSAAGSRRGQGHIPRASARLS